jgi:hypothetical protein
VRASRPPLWRLRLHVQQVREAQVRKGPTTARYPLSSCHPVTTAGRPAQRAGHSVQTSYARKPLQARPPDRRARKTRQTPGAAPACGWRRRLPRTRPMRTQPEGHHAPSRRCASPGRGEAAARCPSACMRSKAARRCVSAAATPAHLTCAAPAAGYATRVGSRAHTRYTASQRRSAPANSAAKGCFARGRQRPSTSCVRVLRGAARRAGLGPAGRGQ